MTFESEGLYIVAIYIWLLPASYVVFLTTLVYAPGTNDRGHIVFVLSVCLFVCLSVCLLSTLTFAITFEP